MKRLGALWGLLLCVGLLGALPPAQAGQNSGNGVVAALWSEHSLDGTSAWVRGDGSHPQYLVVTRRNASNGGAAMPPYTLTVGDPTLVQLQGVPINWYDYWQHGQVAFEITGTAPNVPDGTTTNVWLVVYTDYDPNEDEYISPISTSIEVTIKNPTDQWDYPITDTVSPTMTSGLTPQPLDWTYIDQTPRGSGQVAYANFAANAAWSYERPGPTPYTLDFTYYGVSNWPGRINNQEIHNPQRTWRGLTVFDGVLWQGGTPTSSGAMYYNMASLDGGYYTATADLTKNTLANRLPFRFAAQYTASHEHGHVLGLLHSAKNSLMAQYVRDGYHTYGHLWPGQAEFDALATLY